MKKETLLTAGEFAALHRINKKTLHYYDEIGRTILNLRKIKKLPETRRDRLTLSSQVTDGSIDLADCAPQAGTCAAF